MNWRTLFRREAGQIEEAVERAVVRVLDEHAKATTEEIAAIGTIRKLRGEVDRLKEKLADLKTDQKQAEREIEHKVGLAKLRQEAEAELAQDRLDAREQELERGQAVAVREAKVAAREEAFKKADELLGAQVERMERLVETLVGALPSAEILAEIGRG